MIRVVRLGVLCGEAGCLGNGAVYAVFDRRPTAKITGSERAGYADTATA